MLNFFIITTIFCCVAARESLLFDSDESGFTDWWIHFHDVSSVQSFKTIHYPNKTQSLTVLKSKIPDGLEFLNFDSPAIDIQPAWKVFVQFVILVNSTRSTPSWTYHLAYNAGQTTNLEPVEKRSFERSRTLFDPKKEQEIDVKQKNRTQTFQYLYFNIWFQLPTLLAHHPHGVNITLSSFKISYLNCPADTTRLAIYPNTPASKVESQRVHNDGVCVANAVRLDENLILQRTCDHEAKTNFTGSCVCKETFEEDSTGKNCKLCSERFYKSTKGEAQCQKCGKNSFNTPKTRFECRCGSVESGATFRIKEEEDKENWSADCYAYPTKVRDVKTIASSLTNTTIGLKWTIPSDPGELEPITYVVECISPKDACLLFPEIGGHREMQRTQDESIVLKNLTSHTNFTVRVCTHNEASLSNLGSDVGGKPACSNPIQDDEATITQDGYPTAVKKLKNLVINPASETNTVTWEKPVSTGSSSYEYLVAYGDEEKKVPEQNTIYSFTVEQPPENLLINVTVSASAKPKNGPLSGQTLTGPPTNIEVKLLAPYVDKLRTVKIAVGAVFGTIGFILLLLLIVYLYRWYQEKAKLYEEEIYQMELKQIYDKNKIDLLQMEIDTQKGHTNLYVSMETRLGHVNGIYDSEPIYEKRPQVYNFKKLKDCQPLGEGEFGFVIKAKVTNICGHQGDSWVAVKRLKAKCTATDREDFVGELNLLKEVGHHHNIVRMLGECTDPLCIILEYQPGGDLLGYLKKSRGYIKRADGSEESFLNSKDLLKFSLEICEGMKHIASNGIVHRDLAARNVLVGYNKICKISDLGLARKLNEEGYYHRTQKEKLPIRWMPLESIKRDVAVSSEKSDVWSFGITLYEIFTIGTIPYPGMKAKEIPQFLAEGRRMEKPEIRTCTLQIYSLMCDCWEHSNVERPTFNQLVERIQGLQEAADENYWDLDLAKEYDAYFDLVGNGVVMDGDTLFIADDSHYDVETKKY